MCYLGKMTLRFGLVAVILLAMILGSGYSTIQVLAATAPNLLTAQNFAVLGASTVTNTGPSVLTNGNLGVSPGSAITGFPPGTVAPPGTTHITDAVAGQARTDANAAYINLAGQTPFTNLTGQDLGLVGTLLPGVYHFDSSAQLTGTLTLNALNDPNSVFVFQIGTALTTASNSSVVVINAPPNWCNKFWQIGSSATLGTNTAFVGTIIADQSITLNTGASLYGRAIALNGAVTLDNNLITVPACGAHLSLTKTVNPTVYGSSGEVLIYTLVATNDGTTTLTNVSISDPGLVGIFSTPSQPATLLPGDTLMVTGNRTITAGDVALGSLTNNATASGAPPVGNTVSANTSVTAYKQQNSPHLSLTKTVSPTTFANVGDVLNYTLVATNDGNTTLTSVFIIDPGLSPTSSTPSQGSSLAVGATMTVNGTRTIAQTDLNNGSLFNSANATGTANATPVLISANATSAAIQSPSLLLTKTVNPLTFNKVGDILTYTLVATNNGNIPVNGVTISDPGLNNIVSIPGQPANLAPLATLKVTGTRTVTQADLDRGSLANTGNTTGTPLTGGTVSDTATVSSTMRIGGEVSSINKAIVLAPWLGLGLILTLGAIVLLLRRRTGR